MNLKHEITSNKLTEHLFREFYQEVFSSLVIKFGTQHIELIEDALQESFYKALKSWKYNSHPKEPKGWLFMVTKNHIINELKRNSKSTKNILDQISPSMNEFNEKDVEDDQLNLLVACSQFNLKPRAKLVFTLKAICGFGVAEISNGLQIGEENVYKLVQRGKHKLKKLSRGYFEELQTKKISEETIFYLEQIIYFMFNEGYDSISKTSKTSINKEICFEAVRLASILEKRIQNESTQNLLALFYFHMARFDSRISDKGEFISLRNQNRTSWDKDLMQLGFHYLIKPEQLNRYYLEGLIASLYLTASTYEKTEWLKILKLYDTLLELQESPIIKLNRAICLLELGQNEEGITALENIKDELKDSYVYYSMSMAEYLLDKDKQLALEWYKKSLKHVNQKFRKELIEEKMKRFN